VKNNVKPGKHVVKEVMEASMRPKKLEVNDIIYIRNRECQPYKITEDLGSGAQGSCYVFVFASYYRLVDASPWFRGRNRYVAIIAGLRQYALQVTHDTVSKRW
jgi:hypothetical protein